MMRCINRFFLILSISLFAACDDAETAASLSSFVLPAGAVTSDYEAIAGLQKVVAKDGERILTEGDLLNGVRHGSWATYDVSGTLQTLETYYMGKKQGVALKFDNQGYVDTKSFYHNDLLSGEYIKYNRKQVVEKRQYQNGLLEGTARKYYANGNLMEEAPYVNGKLDGIARWYDQEGNLTIAYRYEDGELVDKEPELKAD